MRAHEPDRRGYWGVAITVASRALVAGALAAAAVTVAIGLVRPWTAFGLAQLAGLIVGYAVFVLALRQSDHESPIGHDGPDPDPDACDQNGGGT